MVVCTLKHNKQVCPRSRGKGTELLRLLATPTLQANPARVAHPTHLQFQEFTKQQPLSGALGIPSSKKPPIDYSGVPHICTQNYPLPLTDPQTPLPASFMDPSNLPCQTASGIPDPIRRFSTMYWTDRQSDRQTDRLTDTQTDSC